MSHPKIPLENDEFVVVVMLFQIEIRKKQIFHFELEFKKRNVGREDILKTLRVKYSQAAEGI